MAAAPAIVRSSQAASNLLHPERRRVLELLQQPDSAAGLARRLGVSRQTVGYHLRELETNGLLKLVEERKKGNCIERLVQATARSYILSPEILGSLGRDPGQVKDHVSSGYLLHLANRAIREVAELREAADAKGQKLATMSLESEVRFANPARRNAFAQELADAFMAIASKYQASEPDARGYRMFVSVYPKIESQSPPEPPTKENSDASQD